MSLGEHKVINIHDPSRIWHSLYMLTESEDQKIHLTKICLYTSSIKKAHILLTVM